MTGGLPVLQTCGGCGLMKASPVHGGLCMHTRANLLAVVTPSGAPPLWCPLPRAEPDRDLLRAAFRAGAVADGGPWTDSEIDELLALRKP